MPNNWEEMGIKWVAGEVRRQNGEHATDRTVIGTAQIPDLVDIDAAVKAGLSGAILKGCNGTSWRVLAQDVCRGLIEKNRRVSAEVMQEAVFNRLRSVMTRGTVVIEKIVEKVMHTLPDGTNWDGTDETEFRQMYLVQLIDAGVENAVAQILTTNVKW